MYTGSSKSDNATTSAVTLNENEIIHKAADKAHDAINYTAQNVSRATETASRQIHESPLQSALIALGIGYLLGKLS